MLLRTERFTRRLRLLPALLATAAVITTLSASLLQEAENLQAEEERNYYKKWLEEDVVYIITDEEREVFAELTTPEEKERFIEQFWERRDPEPGGYNEFKEEHYRRIAYANEHFHAGVAGWRTDRGKIYIIHGPPDEREIHLAGESYRRPMREGGGSTRTYPFEMWRYRHIDGIGDQVVLEFVDKTLDTNYTLALNPEEKDALMYAPTLGMTLAEEMGLVGREARPFFSPENRFNYPLMNYSYNDGPFQRLERYSRIQQPTRLKYKDLEAYVDVDITYETLPARLRSDFIRLNGHEVLGLLTVTLEKKDLSFRPDDDRQVARVSLYGVVTGLNNRVHTRFEDDLIATGPVSGSVSSGQVAYQKIVSLEGRWRYKLDLVLKDMHSGNVGVITTALAPPSFGDESLSTSSLILSESVKVLEEAPDSDEMFLLGNVKIRPSIEEKFLWYRPFYVYLQIYNAQLDQSSYLPSLRTTYRIRRDGELLKERTDEEGASIQYVSSRRVALLSNLAVDDLTAGDYLLEIEIRDQISGQETTVEHPFTIVDPPPAQAANSE